MIVELVPDGPSLELEEPSRAALLSCGGSMHGVARTAWADRSIDIDSARTDAVFAAARWALWGFAASEDGLEFAQQCLFWGTTPAREMHIEEPGLADVLNSACRQALLAAVQAMAGQETPTKYNNPTKGAVNGSPQDDSKG
jgi:hypothetical protein